MFTLAPAVVLIPYILIFTVVPFGNDVFAENLQNVVQARPVLASYDQISQFMGQAVVAALLGQSSPADALDRAAGQVDQVLSIAA